MGSRCSLPFKTGGIFFSDFIENFTVKKLDPMSRHMHLDRKKGWDFAFRGNTREVENAKLTPSYCLPSKTLFAAFVTLLAAFQRSHGLGF